MGQPFIVAPDQERILCEEVAVVVLGYNSQKYLARFLPSLVATSYDKCTIVYVDNASDDDSVDYVEKTFPSIRVLRIYENHGFTGGYTYSLPFIEAEYYVLINSDVRVEPDWLTEMMQVIKQDEGIGACQPKIRHEPEPQQFDYGGASGGYIDRFGFTFCRGRIFHVIEDDRGQYEDNQDIFWASGACMLIRASLYHELGGLDNDFYAHMEEIDLCWRLRNHGYRIVVVPSSVVYHVGGSIISYGSFSKIYHNFRNNLIMMYKNLPKRRLVITIIARMAIDQIRAMMTLFTGRWTEFRAIWAAHLNFIKNLSKWSVSRRRAQSAVRQPKLSGIYQRSIVLDAFILKRTTFGQLHKKDFE